MPQLFFDQVANIFAKDFENAAAAPEAAAAAMIRGRFGRFRSFPFIFARFRPFSAVFVWFRPFFGRKTTNRHAPIASFPIQE